MFELRMALCYLTARRREGPVTAVTLLCTAGVFVGVVALVLALALMTGFQVDIRRILLASNPHVVITPGVREPRFTREEAASIAAIASRRADVVAAAPIAEEPGLLRSRLLPEGRPVLVKGLDPDRDRVLQLQDKTSESAWRALVEDSRASALPPEADDEDSEGPLSAEDLAEETPPAALLGLDLALDLGVTPGDVVHLVTTAPELSALGPTPRSRALKVVGLLETEVREYDQAWVVVGLERLRPGEERVVDGVQLALADPFESARVAGELEADLGRNHVVRDWTTQFSRLFAAFRWEKLMMMMALGLIGVVAGFNIFTILSLNVMARIDDIGILSALGATRGSITRIFTLMGLILGTAGTVAGLGVGAVAASLLDRHQVIALDPSVYLLSHVPFRLDASDLAFAACGMVLVSFLATIVPARTAAGLDPVVALRAG